MNPAIEVIPLSQLDLSLSEMRIINMAQVLQIEKSMRLHGQLQPVVVRVIEGGYQLIDGFKRYYASESLVMDALQCLVLEVDLAQAKVLLLSYNRSPQRMEVWEEAMILKDLMQKHSLDQGRLAKLTGYSRSWVSRRLALISKVDEEVSTALKMGVLTGSHARALIRLPRGNQKDVALAITRFNLTSRQSNALAEAYLKAEDKNMQHYIADHPEDVLIRHAKEDNQGPYDARLSSFGNEIMQCLSDGIVSVERLFLKLKSESVNRLTETERIIMVPQMKQLLKTCNSITGLIRQLEIR